MSLDMDEFVRDIKRMIYETNGETKPFSFLYGTVVSEEPNLKIFVNQKLVLDSQQLILTNSVRDYTIYMSTAEDHFTEEERNINASPDPTQFAPHKHTYKGKKKWTVHLSLKSGEKVLLLRCNGGQKYIVLDRVEACDG